MMIQIRPVALHQLLPHRLLQTLNILEHCSLSRATMLVHLTISSYNYGPENYVA